MNSEKNKTKIKESTKSKKTTNNFKQETNRSLHVNASNQSNVEMKDKLLIHPVGRWFEEVITTIYQIRYILHVHPFLSQNVSLFSKSTRLPLK